MLELLLIWSNIQGQLITWSQNNCWVGSGKRAWARVSGWQLSANRSTRKARQLAWKNVYSFTLHKATVIIKAGGKTVDNQWTKQPRLSWHSPLNTCGIMLHCPEEASAIYCFYQIIWMTFHSPNSLKLHFTVYQWIFTVSIIAVMSVSVLQCTVTVSYSENRSLMCTYTVEKHCNYCEYELSLHERLWNIRVLSIAIFSSWLNSSFFSQYQ